MNGIGRKLVGQWNTKTVVGVALGAILMAIMMVYIQIPIFTQVQFSLAPVVIVIVGALFGAAARRRSPRASGTFWPT